MYHPFLDEKRDGWALNSGTRPFWVALLSLFNYVLCVNYTICNTWQ